MKLELLPGEFSICQVADFQEVNEEDDFFFCAKTDEEYSLVCASASVPGAAHKRDDGWRCFRIQGSMEFSLVGVVAGISRVIAEAKIGIFVVSTFNTDYILVKAANLAAAQNALRQAGYVFVS